MTKLAPEWVRTSDPVIRSPAHYRWTTAPALGGWQQCDIIFYQRVAYMISRTSERVSDIIYATS